MAARQDEPVTARPWQVEVCFPFSYGLSKNRAWRHGRGRTFLSAEQRTSREALALVLRGALQKARARPVQNFLTVSVHVAKPSMSGDATNFVDFICDAVTVATGVDDHWYQLGGLTWSIEPTDPFLRITVSQWETEDGVLCRRCHTIRGASMFRGASHLCGACRKR